MVRFVNPENPMSKWEMPPGFIGEVPSWVEKHWYFDALCKDGTITTIKSKRDRDIQETTEKGEETPPLDDADDTGEESTDEKPAAKKGRGSK